MLALKNGRGPLTVQKFVRLKDNRPRLTAWTRPQKFMRLRSRFLTRFLPRVEPTKKLFYFTRCCSIITPCTVDVKPYTNDVTPFGTVVLTTAPAPEQPLQPRVPQKQGQQQQCPY